MKLILSSLDFHNEKSKQAIVDNIDKPLEDSKLLFIPNEKADDQRIYSNKYYNRLKKLGFNKENIYVFDDKKASNFTNLNIDLIYVGGGNTFATLKKLRDCGFDKALISYIKNGVTYIGGSCGAHIVGQNIEHLLPFDENYVNLTDFSGLGLVDGIFIVHYDAEEYGPELRREVYQRLVNENKYKVYKLTNEDTLVVEDNK